MERRQTIVVLSAAGASAVGLWLYWRRRRSNRKCSDAAVLAGVAKICETYDLSTKGFLPPFCLRRLPPAFAEWEEIIGRLVDLNRFGQLYDAVTTMKEVSATHILSAAPHELRRAYVILGMLAHSYVNGSEVPWPLIGGVAQVAATQREVMASLPSQLARPWMLVCNRLGMPPVLTAGAVDMWNWCLIDETKEFVPSNLRLINSMTGTATEANFHVAPCVMQMAAAEVTPKVFQADLLVANGADAQLTALLNELTDVLTKFQSIFALAVKNVDRDIFYDVYRPLLGGFYPEGLLLEGVDIKLASANILVEAQLEDANTVRVKSKGPSAGQSTMVLLFDIFLGVAHDKLGKDFQDEMLGYMPERHRRMVIDYRKKWEIVLPVREYIRLAGRPRSLVSAYEGCVSALAAFRRFHFATVTRYLSRTNKGTGASTWSIMLKEMAKSTSNCLGLSS